MEPKTVIVTGANAGIGQETARKLASLGMRVIMACRNQGTGKLARNEIIRSTGNHNVILKKLDVSSLQSIRDFAADINRTEKKLDILIHNAGISLGFSRRAKSVDDIELTMATNHYGPFLLTHLLIDLLKRSAPSRIVIVSSKLYKICRLSLNHLNPVNMWPPLYSYFVSKLANIYFCRELSRRIAGSGVTANCLHPGVVRTGIFRAVVPFPLNYPMQWVVKFFKTVEEGSRTSVYLAVSEDVEGVSGKYFNECKEERLYRYARDDVKGLKFWEESKKIVKLNASDPRI